MAAISRNMAPASCAIAVQLNTIMFKPMQSSPVPVSPRPAEDSRLQGQLLLVVETGTIASQTILRGMMMPASKFFSAYCTTEVNCFIPGTVNCISESWQILHEDSFESQYKAVVRNVTETHCLCRSCFSHDTPSQSQCPALPKWYLLIQQDMLSKNALHVLAVWCVSSLGATPTAAIQILRGPAHPRMSQRPTSSRRRMMLLLSCAAMAQSI
jgi:hypothetical protein